MLFFLQQTPKHVKFGFIETKPPHSFQPYIVCHCKHPCFPLHPLQNTFFTALSKALWKLNGVSRWNPTFDIWLICKVWCCWLVLRFWFKICHSFSYKISLSSFLARICSGRYSLCISLSSLICHHFFIRLFLQFVMLILNFNPVPQYFCRVFSLIPVTESLEMMKGEEQDTQSG